MGLRDFFVLVAVYGILPVAFVRPFVALLLYGWLAYMRPQDLAWALDDTRLSLLAGIALLTGSLLHLGKERLVVWRAQTWIFLFFCFWVLLSGQFAQYPGASEYWTSWLTKACIFCLLTTGLVSTRLRFRLTWVVIAFSLGLLGAKFAVFSIRHGGVGFPYGPVGALNDNNKFAVALVMVLPMLIAIAAIERNAFVRLGAGVVAALCIVTIISTFSRGGFLTLAVALVMLTLRSRRVAVTTVIALALLGSLLLLLPADFLDDYEERVRTIDDYEEDASSMGRIIGWKASWRVAQDHPWLGVGPQNYPLVAAQYGGVQGKVAHSTFFHLLAENGWPAAISFYTVLFLSYWRLRGVRRSVSDTAWGLYASALQVSLVAYVVGSIFLNIVYYELVYQLAALTIPLELLARAEAPERQPSSAEKPAASEWWRDGQLPSLRPASHG